MADAKYLSLFADVPKPSIPTATANTTAINYRPLKPDRGPRPIGGYCGPVLTESFRQKLKMIRTGGFRCYDERGWLDSDDDDSRSFAPADGDDSPTKPTDTSSSSFVRPRPIVSADRKTTVKSRQNNNNRTAGVDGAETDDDDVVDDDDDCL